MTPWHQVVRLKSELRSGALSLAEFAADLHEVVTRAGRRRIYEDPAKFFALTYPTHALRDLVRDVAARLAGQSPKAVRQLEMTYGGGKTHTLIALHHLFHDPAALPDLPAVHEFREHADHPLSRAVTAALCFDKIDVEKGIEDVRDPNGETRSLKHPWSVLAFQLAGADGLRILHADDLDEERDTPPAEPLLVKLIDRQQRDGSATLILIDEVMMYARARATGGGDWIAHLRNFFQYLTQAVAKTDRAAIVASILATDPAKQNDPRGREVLRDLSAIFRRQREEGVQPVQKEDVAEVLRRRFFEPDGIRDPQAHKPHVIRIVKGIAKLDETTRAGRKEAERRFLDSFPFHPDITDVFYSRWTQIEGFQRTRGILRTLATALRDAEPWDRSPLVGPAVLLAKPDATAVSEAIRELAGTATTDSVEGKKTEWVPLLEAEFRKARDVQREFPALAPAREVEQAVAAVFLHSQPTGAKAHTPELLRLVGASAPDQIELDKGLRRWRDTSWFLDDEDIEDDPGDIGAEPRLPRSWRLGNAPNLKQMHDEACRHRVTEDMVEASLLDFIGKTNSLVKGASAAGARVHRLPRSPGDVRDDGEFRYLILGPEAVSASGKPSPKAQDFLDHTTGPNRPRVYRNALVAAVPSREGMEAARTRVRHLLGWEDVDAQLARQAVDPLRAERLRRQLRTVKGQIPDVIRHAYGIVVTVNEANKVHAFRLPGSAQPLFAAIKEHPKARITDTPVNPEALLPDGPYDLWREGEESRFANQLAESFARYPYLPKVLRPKLVTETVLDGVRRGFFVARLKRPDGSVRTWWRESVDPAAAEDTALEMVLPREGAAGGAERGPPRSGQAARPVGGRRGGSGAPGRDPAAVLRGRPCRHGAQGGLRRARADPRLRPGAGVRGHRQGRRARTRLDDEPPRDFVEGAGSDRHPERRGHLAPPPHPGEPPGPNAGIGAGRVEEQPHQRRGAHPGAVATPIQGRAVGTGSGRNRCRREQPLAGAGRGERANRQPLRPGRPGRTGATDAARPAPTPTARAPSGPPGRLAAAGSGGERAPPARRRRGRGARLPRPGRGQRIAE